MERRWRRCPALLLSLFSLVTAQETERPPVFTTSPSNIAVPEGVQASLNCSAVGYPRPSYEWLSGFVDQSVVMSNRRRYVAVDGSLVFNPFNSTVDKGIYYCRAKNRLGAIKSQGVLVEMAGSPTVTIGPRNVTVVAGGAASFTCAGDGFPSPNYRWSRARDETFGRVGASLRLKSVTPDDADEYVCEVSNVAGRATAGAFLHVQYSPSAEVVPHSQTLPHHATPVLTCNFKGFPFVSVEWLKDGKLLEETNVRIGVSTVVVEKRTGEGESKLTLKNLHKQDSGTYSCVVRNGLGSYTAKSRMLVQFPPEAPLLRSPVIDGTTVNLTWSPAHPSPSPPINTFTVAYSRDDLSAETKQITITSGDSRGTSVSGLRKGKLYYFQVAASNTIGKSLLSNIVQADIAATAPDAAPIVLSARSLSSQSVYLTWTQPADSDGGATISQFIIEYTINRLKWTSQSVAGNTNSTSIGYLASNTSYIFRLFAVNAVGRSLPSTTIRAKTNALGSPSIVRAIRVSNVFGNSVRLTWKMLDTTKEENRLIERFVVRLSSVEKAEDAVSEVRAPFVTEEGRVTSEFTDLIHDAVYHATVTAVNRQGEGPMSVPVTFRTKARIVQSPSPPVVATKDNVQTNIIKDNIAYVAGGIAAVVVCAAGFIIVIVWRCRRVVLTNSNSSSSSLTTKSDLESPTASLPPCSPARHNLLDVNSKTKLSGDPTLSAVRAAFENALAPTSTPQRGLNVGSDAFRSLGDDTLGEERFPSNIGSRVSSLRDDLHLGLHLVSDSGMSVSQCEERTSESSVELVKKKTVTFGNLADCSSHPVASSPIRVGPNNQAYSKRGIQLHKVDSDEDSYV